jgi:hypothetical protein
VWAGVVSDDSKSLTNRGVRADEVYYSGDRFNGIRVRIGEARSSLAPKRVDERATGEAGDVKLDEGLSFALLAHALDDDARALRLHYAFRRRVGTILPDRWTLSRSRIRAYADMLEQYQAVGIKTGAKDE